MEYGLCPNCNNDTVRIVEKNDGSEGSQCYQCTWTGPMCFGRKHSTEDPKCAGGNDPAYWSGSSHTRGRCSFYSRCQEATRTMLPRQTFEMTSLPTPGMQFTQIPVTNQNAPAPNWAPFNPQVQQVQQPTQQFMPINQLAYRPMQQQMPMQAQVQPQAQMQPMRVGMPQQYPVYGGYVAGQQQGAPTYYVPPENACMPMAVPQNHIMPGMETGSFLANPEPYKPGDPILPMALKALMRSIGKAIGYTILNISDYFPWGS